MAPPMSKTAGTKMMLSAVQLDLYFLFLLFSAAVILARGVVDLRKARSVLCTTVTSMA